MSGSAATATIVWWAPSPHLPRCDGAVDEGHLDLGREWPQAFRDYIDQAHGLQEEPPELGEE